MTLGAVVVYTTSISLKSNQSHKTSKAIRQKTVLVRDGLRESIGFGKL